jgi:hypothetical protein
MGKSIILYSVSVIFIILGLASLLYAFTKKKNEIEKYKDYVNPPAKNFGCICITGGFLFFLWIGNKPR